MKVRYLILTLAALLIAFGDITADAQTTFTASVDCNNRESINDELGRHRNTGSLIIEIRGICNENVIVTRDRVTLRGANPATDGIQAVLNTNQIDAALWVRGAHLVVVENLKLTGGFAGLLATDANTPHLRVVNSRLEGNTNYGAVLESSLLQAEDTIFSSNGFINAAAFQASRFQCTRCTLADPGGGVGANGRTNLLAAAGASIVVAESTFINGGVNSNAASVLIFDSTVNGFAPNGASLADGQSTVNLTRTQLSGHIVLSNGSNTQLFGVTQTLATPFNIVDNNSFIRIGDAPPAAGGPPSIPSSLLGFSVRGFSNGMLLQNSQINGNLNCTQGGNTFCAVPAKVTGSSNCALCPKP